MDWSKNKGVSLRFEQEGKWVWRLGKESARPVRFPENFEILQLHRCVFVYSEPADNVFQLPK